MPRTVTFELPNDLADFLEERVEQVVRHARLIEGVPDAEFTVEDALVELVRYWRNQVDPQPEQLMDLV